MLTDLEIKFTLAQKPYPENKPYFMCPDIAKHSKWEGNSVTDFVYLPKVKEKLKELGYDSVLVQNKNTNYQEEWIVLDSQKIELKDKKMFSLKR